MKTIKTRAEKAYFGNNPKFGRTTKLVDLNGNVLIECMGTCLKKDLIAAYERETKKNVKQ